jgi:peptide/nickel transport system permease protein
VAFFFVVALIFCAIFCDYLTPYAYDAQDLSATLQGPSLAHICGTDDFGRDIFTRILRGARVSLLVSLMGVCMSTVVAIVLGSIAGYYGGKVDNVIMRVMDMLIAIPGLLLSMTVSAALGTGMMKTAIAMAIPGVAQLTRQLRGSIMTMKGSEYIEAARAFGGHDLHILGKHIIPNCLSPLIVQFTLSLGSSIMSISGLSFLGLGVQPPTPEWGNMVAAGQDYIRNAPHMVLFPGLAVMLAMLAFNLLGDGLRDALDPRMKQ